MKKILVVLLILAVTAGSAFAEWSVSSGGEIGTIIDFHDTDHGTRVGAGTYNFWEGWGEFGGRVAINWNRDGFWAGLDINQSDYPIGAGMSYAGEFYSFEAKSDLNRLLTQGDAGANRLWGWYTFMDGMITVEVAVDSRDTNYWNATGVLGDVLDNRKVVWYGIGYGGSGGFSDVDHHNYLLMNFAPIEGLQVGFMLPGIFSTSSFGGATFDVKTVNGGTTWEQNWGGSSPRYGATAHIEDVLKNTRIGLQYTGMEGLNISLQAVPNMGNNDILALSFGATYRVTPQISAQAQFEGYIGYGDGETKPGGFASTDQTNGAFAVGVNYNEGPLGAYVRFGMDFSTVDNHDPVMGIGIGGSYTIVPTSILGTLDAIVLISDRWGDDNIRFGIVPQLFVNFLGTGAGGYWNWGTGMIVRYHVAFDGGDYLRQHSLDVTFKWSL